MICAEGSSLPPTAAEHPPLRTQRDCRESIDFPRAVAELAAEGLPVQARPAHGAATARRLSARSRARRRPTANWQPKALPTQGWRSASRPARSRRSGPADRSHTLPDQALQFRLLNFAAYSPRNSQRRRRSRSACLQRTDRRDLFQYISAVLVHRRVAMCHCSEVAGSAAGQAGRRSRRSCLLAAEGPDYSGVGRRRCGDLPGMSMVAARSSATPARRRAGEATR